ncbi:MAG: hypothetical protein QOH90_1742 [Actinomycetota bacterium]|nr:hypothetical protein [Actinomycetota bacterium]
MQPDALPDEVTFPGVLASAARLYRARFKLAAVLFAVISFAITALALLGLTEVGKLQLIAAFLSQIILPSILGSIAVAAAALIYEGAVKDRLVTIRDAVDALKPMQRDIFMASLFSSMLALWSIILLGQFGLVLLPLFFGPPIIIQAIAIEKLSVRDARSRAREILRGRTGRVLLYLLVIALGIGLLGGAVLVTVGLAIDAALDGALLFTAYSVVQVLVAALTLPFMAAAVYVCYATLVRIKDAEATA